VVGYTQKDIDEWAESLARAFTSVGMGKNDILQVSYGYGLFTGGSVPITEAKNWAQPYSPQAQEIPNASLS